MAASFDGLLLVSPHEPLWVYAELALEPKGLPVRYFASAKEALFWLRDHTPKAILLDTDLDVDPFAVLIPPSEKLRTTAEVVRVQAMEKPLTREKLYRFLGLA